MNLKLTTKIEDRWAPSASPRADGAHLSHLFLQMVPICLRFLTGGVFDGHHLLRHLLRRLRRWCPSVFSFLVFFSILVFPSISSASVRFQSSPSSKATSLTDGLVGHWTFDGKDLARNVADRSGRGNHGYMTGFTSTSSAQVAGKIGQGLKFDGSNDYTKMAYSSLWDWHASDYTVSLWTKSDKYVDSGGIPLMIGKMNPTNLANYWSFGVLATRKLDLYYWNGAQTHLTGSTNVSLNKWNHVLFTVSGNNINMYINGAVEKTGAVSGTPQTDGSTPLTLGAFNYNDSNQAYFNGSLDDIRVYNRALSPAEIKQLYQMGQEKLGLTPSNKGGSLSDGLVGHWTFDGKDLARNVADRSGLGNTGYMKGFTSTSSAQVAGKIGQGLKFDGVNDYVKANTTYSTIAGGPVSISLWAKLSIVGVTSDAFAIMCTNGGRFCFTVSTDSNSWVLKSRNAVDNSLILDSNISTKINTWVHITSVHSTGLGLIYVNGVLANSTVDIDDSPLIASPVSATAGASIGNSGVIQNFFPGILDDVRIYNRALSASEIKQLYQMGQEKLGLTPSNKGGSLSDGLVGHWTFDGKDLARNVADRSGLGNTGYMKGFTSTSSAVTSGKIGQGLKFDGVNDYVVSNSNPISDYPFTLSTWIKVPAISGQYVALSYANTGSNVIYYAIGSNGNVPTAKAYMFARSSLGDENNVSGTSNLAPNSWKHIVGVYTTATDRKLYVNGVLEKTTTVSIPFVAGSNIAAGVSIREAKFGYWPNAIDDVRIYNSALSPSEIKQLYLMGK